MLGSLVTERNGQLGAVGTGASTLVFGVGHQCPPPQPWAWQGSCCLGHAVWSGTNGHLPTTTAPERPWAAALRAGPSQAWATSPGTRRFTPELGAGALAGTGGEQGEGSRRPRAVEPGQSSLLQTSETLGDGTEIKMPSLPSSAAPVGIKSMWEMVDGEWQSKFSLFLFGFCFCFLF